MTSHPEAAAGSPAAAPRLRLTGVNIDAPDPHALAAFYCRLLGLEITRADEDDVHTNGTLSFQRERAYQRPMWPSAPGDQQMMMHLEVAVDDLDAAVTHALAAGATLAAHQPQPDVRVCLDPAGHPFCLYLGQPVDHRSSSRGASADAESLTISPTSKAGN
jgi:catechol 2,3-dioxygenase-like lactoylglutathione lyase family enzyme